VQAAHTRVAVTSKLVRMGVVLALVPTLAAAVLVTAAQPAAAADEQVAVESASFGLLGPVGIAAVALGFGGLVVGLLRHRRRDRVASAAVTAPMPPVEPRAGEPAR
jgi:hypothetical protein